jgi:cell fate (sporulation/competence/biofilm development) regulator YlbF (YheA/YmcA/DUF963 family)
MDEILDLAAQLGKRIAVDPRGKQMSAAQAALDASLSDRQLLQDYETQQHHIHSLEIAGKPIEPDDKRRLADLHGRVVGSAVIRNLLKAQADYVELMTLVSQRIEDAAFGALQPAEPQR